MVLLIFVEIFEILFLEAHIEIMKCRLLNRFLDHPMNYVQYDTANLRTKILDVGGLDSSRVLNLRGGIPMSIRHFAEVLRQRILVGIILVGRLGACTI